MKPVTPDDTFLIGCSNTSRELRPRCDLGLFITSCTSMCSVNLAVQFVFEGFLFSWGGVPLQFRHCTHFFDAPSILFLWGFF